MAVAGATGLVGRKLLEYLEQREFPFSEMVLFASPASRGRVLHVRGRPCRLEVLDPLRAGPFDLVFFAAAPGVARRFAPLFAEAGALVVDCSADWRLDPGVPLVVPEIQPPPPRRSGVVASPSPEALSLSLAIWGIREEAGICRGWGLIHRPVSAAGRKALEAFEDDLRTFAMSPDPRRCLSSPSRHYGEAGGEEEVTREILKILGGEGVPLAFSCFRVPVAQGIEAAVLLETRREADPAAIRERWGKIPGLSLEGTAGGGDLPAAVRIRSLRSLPGTPPAVSLRVSCDNLAKGSALNALQIAETILLGI